jgi:subtilisin family serine protease
MPETPAGWLRYAIERLCPADDLEGLVAQTMIPGSWLIEETQSPQQAPGQRVRVRLVLPGADELEIERRATGGRLRQFLAAYHVMDGKTSRPALQAIADGACQIRSGRRLRQDQGAWRWLDQLDGDLETVRWTETLQAPWPAGRDESGVRVALVDSGIAYDLPLFQGRLARDENGDPIGYDFWDMDPWPYDGDVSRGPFFPIRHGTAVASVLAREAPRAALIPYRYPRPDLQRMGALVEHAVAAGARIIALPLGSRREKDWLDFEKAIRGRNILAIVSAGNNGRDIDAEPVWPAALTLDNMIVVTSADAFGRLAEGSNWGPISVDVMLPAENVSVVDFRGANGVASGSSYAVPRLAALAARLLDGNPDLEAAALKRRILDRAVPSPYEREDVVAAGWIPDPASD